MSVAHHQLSLGKGCGERARFPLVFPVNGRLFGLCWVTIKIRNVTGRVCTTCAVIHCEKRAKNGLPRRVGEEHPTCVFLHSAACVTA
jgi:hypothetical protein